VVINDGSRDNTEEEALKAARLSPVFPTISDRRSCSNGYQIASENDYDVAIQIDGDGQHDPAYLSQLIRPILEGQWTLCIGSRFLERNFARLSVHWARRFGSGFLPSSRFLTGLHLNISTSGFRAPKKNSSGPSRLIITVDFPSLKPSRSRTQNGCW